VNTDTERNEHQNTEVVDINAAEVVHVPVNTEGQKSTALVNT
jgi:hypothetical protein